MAPRGVPAALAFAAVCVAALLIACAQLQQQGLSLRQTSPVARAAAAAVECGSGTITLPRAGTGAHRGHDHGAGLEAGTADGAAGERTGGLAHGASHEADSERGAEPPDAAPVLSAADAALPFVLVLSPVKNAATHLDRFFANLALLDYSPSRMAVALLDSDSDDVPSRAQLAAVRAAAAASAQVAAFLDDAALNASSSSSVAAAYAAGDAGRVRLSATLAIALAALPALARRYARVALLQHNFGLSLPREARHGQAAQRARRSVMARSRNHLLASALREGDDWVLWVDSDLHSYGAGVLRALLGARRQLVAPNCVMAPGGRSYDLNSWRFADDALGSNATLEAVRRAHDALHGALLRGGQPADTLQLEGYGATGHLYLHQLAKREPGAEVVRLDAVGGAMLLVDAELHRQGLVFPVVPYRHRIETEGLATLALDMGVLAWGMPRVEVVHR